MSFICHLNNGRHLANWCEEVRSDYWKQPVRESWLCCLCGSVQSNIGCWRLIKWWEAAEWTGGRPYPLLKGEWCDYRQGDPPGTEVHGSRSKLGKQSCVRRASATTRLPPRHLRHGPPADVGSATCRGQADVHWSVQRPAARVMSLPFSLGNASLSESPFHPDRSKTMIKNSFSDKDGRLRKLREMDLYLHSHFNVNKL